jgi:hypothetical protein
LLFLISTGAGKQNKNTTRKTRNPQTESQARKRRNFLRNFILLFTRSLFVFSINWQLKKLGIERKSEIKIDKKI